MRLIKDYAGSYYGEDVVDGYDIRVEVNTINNRGWSWSIFVNDKLMVSDGWVGMRLKEIKDDLDKMIEYSIDEYERTTYR